MVKKDALLVYLQRRLFLLFYRATAVWPASSMWISMGDTKHIVKDAASTSTTPIVFGIAKSKAVKLGWADDTGATKPVSTADILAGQAQA